MIPNFGPMEIAIVLVIALIVFGPKRLPELGSGLGRGLREFKESVTGEKKEADPVKTIAASPDATAPVAAGESKVAETRQG